MIRRSGRRTADARSGKSSRSALSGKLTRKSNLTVRSPIISKLNQRRPTKSVDMPAWSLLRRNLLKLMRERKVLGLMTTTLVHRSMALMIITRIGYTIKSTQLKMIWSLARSKICSKSQSRTKRQLLPKSQLKRRLGCQITHGSS